MKHTTETQIKYWQSRLASAIEDKDTAERKLMELGVAINDHNLDGFQNIIDCPNCGEKWDTGKHNACQCGAQLIGEPFRNSNKQPTPDVLPEDGWHSGDEPPYEQDLVQVKLNNGLILNGWHDLNQWNVYYPSCVDLFDGDPLRPGDTVQSWKEID